MFRYRTEAEKQAIMNAPIVFGTDKSSPFAFTFTQNETQSGTCPPAPSGSTTASMPADASLFTQKSLFDPPVFTGASASASWMPHSEPVGRYDKIYCDMYVEYKEIDETKDVHFRNLLGKLRSAKARRQRIMDKIRRAKKDLAAYKSAIKLYAKSDAEHAEKVLQARSFERRPKDLDLNLLRLQIEVNSGLRMKLAALDNKIAGLKLAVANIRLRNAASRHTAIDGVIAEHRTKRARVEDTDDNSDE